MAKICVHVKMILANAVTMKQYRVPELGCFGKVSSNLKLCFLSMKNNLFCVLMLLNLFARLLNVTKLDVLSHPSSFTLNPDPPVMACGLGVL